MHYSNYQTVQAHLERIAPLYGKPKIIDYGSSKQKDSKYDIRLLCSKYKSDYVGYGFEDNQNVDVILDDPYSLPDKDNSADIILCLQKLENVPYPWLLFLEFNRVLREGGCLICVAPSRGHQHGIPGDFWRYQAGSMKSLGNFAGFNVIHSKTDEPPVNKKNKRYDYSEIADSKYWGDSVGIFTKKKGDNSLKLLGILKKHIENSEYDVNNCEFANGLPDANLKNEGKPILVHGSLSIKFDYDKRFITEKVSNAITKGWYEYKEASAALEFLKRGRNILELGGGLGFMSTVILGNLKPKKYTVVEADSRLISYIESTHRLNEVEGAELINCVATSDKKQLAAGKVDLQIGNEFWGSSIKPKSGSGVYTEVKTISLQKIIDDKDPDTLIIDIEGAEIDLFDDVDLKNVNLIMIEVHPYQIKIEGVTKIVNQLADNGLALIAKRQDDKVLVFSK